jgi:hypothetical protein
MRTLTRRQTFEDLKGVIGAAVIDEKDLVAARIVLLEHSFDLGIGFSKG